MREIHGRYQAPKFWENDCQSMSPSPEPHSSKHCSYEMVSEGGGSVVLVEFGAVFCCASSLAPHALRLRAPTHGTWMANWKMRSSVAVTGKNETSARLGWLNWHTCVDYRQRLHILGGIRRERECWTLAFLGPRSCINMGGIAS